MFTSIDLADDVALYKTPLRAKCLKNSLIASSRGVLYRAVGYNTLLLSNIFISDMEQNRCHTWEI